YAFQAIKEADVFGGFNADDHYGNTRETILEYDRLKKAGQGPAVRKTWFDSQRKAQLSRVRDHASGDTWGFAQRLASLSRKRFCDPYLDDSVETFFLQFTYEDLVDPKKPIVREALADQIVCLQGAINSGLKLQKSTGVSDLFETLLADPRINRFDRSYGTVSSLCRRWGKEVAANRATFSAEAGALAPQKTAGIRPSLLKSHYQSSMREVHTAASARRFTVASIFAGGGGSSLGYRLAGGHVLFANEFVSEAAATYEANFPNTRVYQQDIREILTDSTIRDRLLSSVGLAVGDLDILDGSPPCSEFSISGRGISDQSVPKTYSDVTQRGIATLPFDFVDFAHTVRPKIVIMENVPTLAARGADVLERIENSLRFVEGDRAYFVTHAVLNAAEFGTPQKRRRMFMIGVRADIAAVSGLETDGDVLTLYPKPSHVPVSVRDALADLSQTDRDLWPWRNIAMTTPLGRAIRLLPKEPSRLTRPCHVDPAIQGNFTLTRCAWDLPAPTFTVVGQAPNGLSGAIHPVEDRKFSLPELKRLTGVPDDFVLTGTLAQATERICRMVPPPLTRAIAENVLQKILLPLREAHHAD
ncbi:MAG: DNA cytosine methyltransferase, partial [Candidatus Afipia apatlaquensis]|nr:DNA cytosine methyltransferase [Candidatus Afipia apatlaquensis]